MALLLDKYVCREQGKIHERDKGAGNSILWMEAAGFSLLIALSWLTEAVRIPHFLFGEAFAPNWHRALLRSVVIFLVWASVHLATKRLLKRLHYQSWPIQHALKSKANIQNLRKNLKNKNID